jgi:hypothetical protein
MGDDDAEGAGAEGEGDLMDKKQVGPLPCPLCGSPDIAVRDHGVECRGCNLWLGAGTAAERRWRALHGGDQRRLSDGWIVEVWNARAALGLKG